MEAEIVMDTAPNGAMFANLRAKRNDRRFIVNQQALLSSSTSPGQFWAARICDISRRGMQFVLDRPFTNGPQVRISWNDREILGAVRYQKRRDGEYRLGVELSSSWDTLVSDILAQQTEELSESNVALRRTESQLVKTNRELAAALEAAQEASQAKSRFLASVSHELRTPLNGIIGFSQLLQDEIVGPVTSEQKDYLADVLSCSEHLLTLINHVLDLTKIEAGKMEFTYRSIALAEHVMEAIASVKALADSKRIEIKVVLDPRLGTVQADASRLRQVVTNFASNAVKFTPEGGRVTVDLRREGVSSYRVLVQDNGIGIRAEDMPRLFSEFGQLCPSEKARAGTGLGLVITKGIVEAQGGSVGVESVFGSGSRFYAILPVNPTA